MIFFFKNKVFVTKDDKMLKIKINGIYIYKNEFLNYPKHAYDKYIIILFPLCKKNVYICVIYTLKMTL